MSETSQRWAKAHGLASLDRTPILWSRPIHGNMSAICVAAIETMASGALANELGELQ